MPQIKDIQDLLTGELAKRGDWIVANVQTSNFWPVNAQKVRYRGEDIWILPIMNGFFPSVAMRIPTDKTRDKCVRSAPQVELNGSGNSSRVEHALRDRRCHRANAPSAPPASPSAGPPRR